MTIQLADKLDDICLQLEINVGKVRYRISARY